MNEQLYKETSEVLGKLYDILSCDDLSTLLVATGIDRRDAFPWIAEAKANKTLNANSGSIKSGLIKE